MGEEMKKSLFGEDFDMHRQSTIELSKQLNNSKEREARLTELLEFIIGKKEGDDEICPNLLDIKKRLLDNHSTYEEISWDVDELIERIESTLGINPQEQP